MKQEPQSNIINYGLPANMYTKTEAFDQHLCLSKSEAAIHYGSHYHRQRSLHSMCIVKCKQTFLATRSALQIPSTPDLRNTRPSPALAPMQEIKMKLLTIH